MDDESRDTSLSPSVELYRKRLKAASKHRQPDHYDYLELDHSCSASDIRRAYYHFSRMCHPDKCKDENTQSLLGNIQRAYDVLSDEYKRMLYDMKHGFRSAQDLAERFQSLSEVMRENYLNFLTDRREAYLESIRSEHERGGLVVTKAFYGDLSLVNPSLISSKATIQAKDMKGPYIDVTIQLQVMIEHGVLHINSGGYASYAFLPGFYNPIDLTLSYSEHGYEKETHLYILYLFKGDVHEITVSDGLSLKLPMRAHRVYGSYIKGPYPVANL